jgi:hypothetical protein
VSKHWTSGASWKQPMLNDWRDPGCSRKDRLRDFLVSSRMEWGKSFTIVVLFLATKKTVECTTFVEVGVKSMLPSSFFFSSTFQNMCLLLMICSHRNSEYDLSVSFPVCKTRILCLSRVYLIVVTLQSYRKWICAHIISSSREHPCIMIQLFSQTDVFSEISTSWLFI